jgi:hypothetical protein
VALSRDGTCVGELIEDTCSSTGFLVSETDIFDFEENFKKLVEFRQSMFFIP